MAKINVETRTTLTEIDKKLEELNRLEKPRHYLGMSAIGDECARKLFYSFRGAKKREIAASGLRAINDGFMQEDLMIERLRLLPYIELYTTDPNAKDDNQIGCEDLQGHLKGHLDGIIRGIIEAPRTWHVWEHKSVNLVKFKKLEKLKLADEKSALENWDVVYYSQAQLYMHYKKLLRHYLTCTSPGGRDYTSVRTEYNKQYALNLIGKAGEIIFDNNYLPARLSDKREYFKCKWCEFQGICHDNDFPDINCKTCRYLESAENGKKFCHKIEKEIEQKDLFKPCTVHLYNPALINCKYEQKEHCVVYKLENGFKFANCPTTEIPDLEIENLDEIMTSEDLKAKIKTLDNFSKPVNIVRKDFSGEVLKDDSKKVWNKTLTMEI